MEKNSISFCVRDAGDKFARRLEFQESCRMHDLMRFAHAQHITTQNSSTEVALESLAMLRGRHEPCPHRVGLCICEE